MSVYDFAMQMEKDGEAFYRQIAAQISNAGMKKILDKLADDEAVHYSILQGMKEAETGVFPASTVLTDAKNVFSTMRDEKNWDGIRGDHLSLYRKAQEIEEKSRVFYSQRATETSNFQEKEVLFKIAAEEKRHYFLLEQMIQFISRPQTWLENAEFFHLDEY